MIDLQCEIVTGQPEPEIRLRKLAARTNEREIVSSNWPVENYFISYSDFARNNQSAPSLWFVGILWSIPITRSKGNVHQECTGP